MKDFNFFNEFDYRKKQKTTSSTYFGAVVLLLLVAVGITSYFYYHQLIQLRNEKVALENKLQDPTHQQDYEDTLMLSQLAAEIKEERVSVEAVHGQLMASRVVNTLLVKEIAMAKPEEVSIKSINFSRDAVYLEGVANDYDAIARFAHNLRWNHRFDGPFIPSIQRMEGGNYSFTLNFTFKSLEIQTGEEVDANGQGS